MERAGIGDIDSEIAFTALLAAAVSAYPNPSVEIYPLIKFLAILLLGLTLLKRMATVQGITSESRILMITTHIMDPATYLSILYLIFTSMNKISSILWGTNVEPLVFSLASIPLIFVAFLGWELAYKSALTESERTFEETAKRHSGELLGFILKRFANYTNRDRVYGVRSTTQSKISRYVNENRDKEDVSLEEAVGILRHVSITFLIFILVIGSYLGLIVISGYVFSSWWVTRSLLLLTVMITSAFVRLWYSNYGLVKVEERNGYFTFLGDAVTYFLLTWMVLGYQSFS